MDTQKELIDMTRDEIIELVKKLEPGTMLTLEMPEPDDSVDTNENPKM